MKKRPGENKRYNFLSKDRLMTEEELAAIEARAEAATEGPWKAVEDYPMFVGTRYAVLRKRGDVLIVGVTGPTTWGRDGKETEQSRGARRDAAGDAYFIAHARADVPLLVAEVRRLRAELGKTDE